VTAKLALRGSKAGVASGRKVKNMMSTRVAINGLGRIGRTILKLVIHEPAFELAAVNDLTDADNLVYLLRFDTVDGRYSKPVAVEERELFVAGRKLRTSRSRDPLDLPWKELGIELVFECTGALVRREDLEKHVRAGARFVLLSAPSKDEAVETVVHGANVLNATNPSIISCASCTTNCITPIVEVIGRRIGFKKAAMTTVHAYTSSQSVVDGPSKRFRRGRAAGANLVPATTGAALATRARCLNTRAGSMASQSGRRSPSDRSLTSRLWSRAGPVSRRSTRFSSRKPQRSATPACSGCPAIRLSRPTHRRSARIRRRSRAH